MQEASKGLDLPVGPRTLALKCEYSIHCLIFDECDNNKTCDRVIWLHISFNNIRPQPNLKRARGYFVLVHLPAQWEDCPRRKLPALTQLLEPVSVKVNHSTLDIVRGAIIFRFPLGRHKESEMQHPHLVQAGHGD